MAEEAIALSDAVRIATELVLAGVVPTLIDMSKDAEMVVVGCRGLGDIGRRLLGRSVPAFSTMHIARSR